MLSCTARRLAARVCVCTCVRVRVRLWHAAPPSPPPTHTYTHARSWEERDAPHHNWTKFLEAKRKELQRLNGAYKNTLSNAKVRQSPGGRASGVLC
jgi:hypothetical protein